jgi:aspartate/methionine/tyrosine aminotransferase
MRSAKLLILSNPCNPSGGCLHDEDLEYIAWIAAAYDVLIYADESFGRFQFKGRTKSFGVQAGADRRILTAGSLTQEFGLGALRVGWLAGPRLLVRACGMMANLNAPYVPVACQQAAARALSEADESFPGTLDRLRGKRDYAVDRLRGMGLEADCPAAGFYLWVSLAALGMDGRAFAQRLFRGHQVQVGPGCAFGPSGSGHIRLCFATDDGRLREGLARMAASVQEIQKKPSSNPLAIEDRSEEKSFEAATNGATAKVGERPQPAFSRV